MGLLDSVSKSWTPRYSNSNLCLLTGAEAENTLSTDRLVAVQLDEDVWNRLLHLAVVLHDTVNCVLVKTRTQDCSSIEDNNIMIIRERQYWALHRAVLHHNLGRVIPQSKVLQGPSRSNCLPLGFLHSDMFHQAFLQTCRRHASALAYLCAAKQHRIAQNTHSSSGLYHVRVLQLLQESSLGRTA